MKTVIIWVSVEPSDLQLIEWMERSLSELGETLGLDSLRVHASREHNEIKVSLRKVHAGSVLGLDYKQSFTLLDAAYDKSIFIDSIERQWRKGVERRISQLST
jgi:hypothetical protein